MIVNVDILRVTRFYSTIDGRLKILPLKQIGDFNRLLSFEE